MAGHGLAMVCWSQKAVTDPITLAQRLAGPEDASCYLVRGEAGLQLGQERMRLQFLITFRLWVLALGANWGQPGATAGLELGKSVLVLPWSCPPALSVTNSVVWSEPCMSLPPVGSTEGKPRSVIRVAAPSAELSKPWREPWRLSLGQLEKAGHFNPPGSRTCLLASCGLKNPTRLSPAPLDLANMQWTLT